MTLPYFVPIMALLVVVYFISQQEDWKDDPDDDDDGYYKKYSKKQYKKARPAFKYVAAYKGYNLSTSDLKKYHKTMNEAAKTMGAKIFHDEVTPKIDKAVKSAVDKLNADSTRNDWTKTVMETVKKQVNGILKKHEATKAASAQSGSDSGPDDDPEEPAAPAEPAEPAAPKKGVTFKSVTGSKKRKKPKRTKKKSRKKKSRTKRK